MKKYLAVFISLSFIVFIYKQYKNSLKQDEVDDSIITYDQYIHQKYSDKKRGIKVTPLIKKSLFN